MASVAPTVTSTSVSGSYSVPKWRLRCAAIASRSGDLEHRWRAVLVREALAEVHRADASGQRRHLGEDRYRVGLEAPHRHGRYLAEQT
jgi:hypothetical protein